MSLFLHIFVEIDVRRNTTTVNVYALNCATNSTRNFIENLNTLLDSHCRYHYAIIIIVITSLPCHHAPRLL